MTLQRWISSFRAGIALSACLLCTPAVAQNTVWERVHALLTSLSIEEPLLTRLTDFYAQDAEFQSPSLGANEADAVRRQLRTEIPRHLGGTESNPAVLAAYFVYLDLNGQATGVSGTTLSSWKTELRSKITEILFQRPEAFPEDFAPSLLAAIDAVQFKKKLAGVGRIEAQVLYFGTHLQAKPRNPALRAQLQHFLQPLSADPLHHLPEIRALFEEYEAIWGKNPGEFETWLQELMPHGPELAAHSNTLKLGTREFRPWLFLDAMYVQFPASKWGLLSELLQEAAGEELQFPEFSKMNSSLLFSDGAVEHRFNFDPKTSTPFDLSFRSLLDFRIKKFESDHEPELGNAIFAELQRSEPELAKKLKPAFIEHDFLPRLLGDRLEPSETSAVVQERIRWIFAHGRQDLRDQLTRHFMNLGAKQPPGRRQLALYSEAFPENSPVRARVKFLVQSDMDREAGSQYVRGLLTRPEDFIARASSETTLQIFLQQNGLRQVFPAPGAQQDGIRTYFESAPKLVDVLQSGGDGLLFLEIFERHLSEAMTTPGISEETLIEISTSYFEAAHVALSQFVKTYSFSAEFVELQLKQLLKSHQALLGKMEARLHTCVRIFSKEPGQPSPAVPLAPLNAAIELAEAVYEEAGVMPHPAIRSYGIPTGDSPLDLRIHPN